MPALSTVRKLNLAASTICMALLAYAYYAQFVLELEPCPLCILQRVAFMLLTVLFVIAAIRPGRVTAMAIAVVAAAGAAIATRHVWLQSLPADQVPACGPSLDYMLRVFPLNDTLDMIFKGSGQCADVDWLLLGLSMPAWALIALLAIGLGGVVVNWSSRPR